MLNTIQATLVQLNGSCVGVRKPASLAVSELLSDVSKGVDSPSAAVSDTEKLSLPVPSSTAARPVRRTAPSSSLANMIPILSS